MSFVLPIRPSKPSKPSNAPKTPRTVRTTKTLQPPPESPRRRPSLATRAGVVKRRSSVSTTFNAPSMSFFEAMFGDDFPNTFALGDGRSCKSKKTLLDLPTEILEIVCQTLSRTDLKRLRLTNRELAEAVELRIDRVFVSPNRANLDCLNNILNHDQYRLRVREIVWDDAQLDEYPTLEVFQQRLDSDRQNARIALEDHLATLFRSKDNHNTDHESLGVEDCINEEGGLTQLGKVILASSEDQKSTDILADHTASMSVEDSYDLYQKLFQDENEIIKRGWDVAGLQRALTRLPNLTSITITSEVWRPWYPVPKYDTPFYRALPAGFRKPSVWPWISCSHLSLGKPPSQYIPNHNLPAKWRGYSIVVASLVADPVQDLQEFILDTGQENIGLPHEIFALPNIDYTNSIQALSTASIRKFQFSFFEHFQDHRERGLLDRHSCDLDLLKGVIGAMPLLEHLDLKWGACRTEALDFLPDGFLPQKCPRLRFLGLHYGTFTGSCLCNLIIGLKSLETIILDKVDLLISGPDAQMLWGDFFSGLKSYYAGCALRGPSFTWVQSLPADRIDRCHHFHKQWVIIDDELDAFLYDGSESPFIGGTFQKLRSDIGWVMDGRDTLFRKRRSEMLDSDASRQRNPWPIDGAMSDIPLSWRVY